MPRDIYSLSELAAVLTTAVSAWMGTCQCRIGLGNCLRKLCPHSCTSYGYIRNADELFHSLEKRRGRGCTWRQTSQAAPGKGIMRPSPLRTSHGPACIAALMDPIILRSAEIRPPSWNGSVVEILRTVPQIRAPSNQSNLEHPDLPIVKPLMLQGFRTSDVTLVPKMIKTLLL